jgi:hypothetical protein
MTRAAFADVVVRIHTTNDLTGLCVEIARTKHLPATRKRDADKYEQRNERGNKTGACETAETIIDSHISSYFRNVA